MLYETTDHLVKVLSIAPISQDFRVHNSSVLGSVVETRNVLSTRSWHFFDKARTSCIFRVSTFEKTCLHIILQQKGYRGSKRASYFSNLVVYFSSFRSQTAIKTELRPVAVLFCISKQGKDNHLQCRSDQMLLLELLKVQFQFEKEWELKATTSALPNHFAYST